jgi:hypothetical protein
LVSCGTGTSGTFYLHASDGLSSRFIVGEEIRVPCLKIADEWRRRFPHRNPDVIKIDIEGSEWDLLQSEGDFIRQSRFVIVECHRPQAPLNRVTDLMDTLGFKAGHIITALESVQCALFMHKESP